MNKINLYATFCTNTLRHRETAREVIHILSETPENSKVIIDFEGIDFASRSFLHELMSSLNNRKFEFQHQNECVAKMTEIISRSVEVSCPAPLF